MSRSDHALIMLTLAVVGVWGCAQSGTPGPSAAERLKALEVKNAKLEEDFRAVAAARDQLRRRVTALEEQQQAFQQQAEALQKATRERDELREQLAARTVERDNLTGQLAQFRKGLKDLIGQVEAALPQQPAEPVTAVTEEVAVPGKS